MNQFILATPFAVCYANDIDALIPEHWAQEGLAILRENMVAANLVHRDFQDEFARFGDTVHTRRPGEFVAKRKTNADSVTVQNATATDVPVVLNQHIHVSFMLKDGEETLAFQDLVATYLNPAMLANARLVDQIVLGQYPQFLANWAGGLDAMTSSNVKEYILATREKMNINKAYTEGRNLIWTPSSETVALSLAEFTNAQNVGDDGTAMAEAFLGRKFGFQNWMCQNMADVAIGSTLQSGAINNMAGYAAGVTSLTVDGFTGAVPDNAWLTIAGDDTPHQVASATETLGNTTTLVLASPGLRRAVADNAVVKVYTPGAVNAVGGYAAGYTKEIVVDAFTVAPKVGQFVTFGAQTHKYTVMQATTTSLLLDRALEAALTDDLAVNIGPAGSYNFAFHRDAITLVTRPLQPPRPGTGALSAVVSDEGVGMRATITYNGSEQGHLVTLDFLLGVKVLDTNLGAVMFG
jgi:hypothetical protein